MLRRYTVEEYMEKVEWVREAIPGIALSTDVIVAFPGETVDEYQETLDLMRAVRFDEAYMYRYSPRDGTPATRLPLDQFIPADEGQARLEGLIEMQRQIMLEVNQAWLGRTVEVLVEKEGRRGGIQGRTDSNKIVNAEGGMELVGSFVDVRLMSTTGATFNGERLEAPVERVA
jgi:tRNA-2-methylthio-N6-dimethylallyladenosine synthase